MTISSGMLNVSALVCYWPSAVIKLAFYSFAVKRNSKEIYCHFDPITAKLFSHGRSKNILQSIRDQMDGFCVGDWSSLGTNFGDQPPP